MTAGGRGRCRRGGRSPLPKPTYQGPSCCSPSLSAPSVWARSLRCALPGVGREGKNRRAGSSGNKRETPAGDGQPRVKTQRPECPLVLRWTAALGVAGRMVAEGGATQVLLGDCGAELVGRSWSAELVGCLSGGRSALGLKPTGARGAVWVPAWGEELWTCGSTAPVLFLLCFLYSLPWRPRVILGDLPSPPLHPLCEPHIEPVALDLILSH